MKIKISKSQWQNIGKETGWLNKKALFGPNFAEFYGSETWKSQFGKPITTNIIVDNSPLVMSTQMADESQVVVVEHNGNHIGVYDPKRNGFDVTYTKDMEKYAPLKNKIDDEAKKILEAKPENKTQAKIKNIKIIKMSQSLRLDDNKSKILQKIFDAIPGKEGKDHTTNKTTSKEILDEAMGRMWIQAYMDSDMNSMKVSRYYESEYLDQQWAKTLKIPINWEKPQETVSQILAAFQSLKTRN
jgi:hypothetical protein